MIGKLTGIVEEKGAGEVTLNVNGVGYSIYATPDVTNAVREGKMASLFTHLHVRETALELYGFLDEDERDFFKLLISVSGIGPRSALGVLSVAPLSVLRPAIASGDSTYLTKVSGIGKKTSQKIVLELKDKLISLGVRGTAIDNGDADTLAALNALGYTISEARSALNTVPKKVKGTSERVRSALKALGKNHG